MSESIEKEPLAPGPEEPMTIDVDLVSQQAISSLLSDYGDIVKIHDSKRQGVSYIVTNPDAIKHILITNHGNYLKGSGFERVKMLLGNGIIVSDGEFWRRQRTMIQPAFSRKKILALCEMIKQVTQRLIPRWEQFADSGEAIDITTEMSEFALEIILRALISDDLDQLIVEQGENPFAFLTDDPTRDLAVAMRFRQLGKLIQQLIDQRRDANQYLPDLLSALMQATDKSGEPMTDKELIDEVMTMIIAGHETTGGTLNWIWYELSQHPDAEVNIVDEINQFVEQQDIDVEALSNLRYTRQCIDEALRLYPPVWLFSRKAIKDDIVGGYTIPAGSNVFLSPYFVQRDATLWDKPDTFNPEHFANNGSDIAHKFAFIPFSAGSRRCIGEYFSYVEMQTHLAIMLKQFKLEAIPGQSIKIEPAINLRTLNSIMMQIHRR